MITIFTKINDPHSHYLRFSTYYFQQTIPHYGCSRIYTQNDFLFYRLNHLITSIKVGKPTTLSLNIFIISSFRCIPC